MTNISFVFIVKKKMNHKKVKTTVFTFVYLLFSNIDLIFCLPIYNYMLILQTKDEICNKINMYSCK